LFTKAGTKELWKRTAVDDLWGKSRSFQAKGAGVYISFNSAILSLVENSPYLPVMRAEPVVVLGRGGHGK
jgi:hypothetical protein